MKMKIERCMFDTYPVSIGDEHEIEGLSEDRNKNQGEQGVSSIVPSCHGTFFPSGNGETMGGIDGDDD
jgi:hypothetical protein